VPVRLGDHDRLEWPIRVETVRNLGGEQSWEVIATLITPLFPVFHPIGRPY
jgi:hypothetical protein